MLRLTGGEFNGRTIHAPANLKTRPTQAKLRQALFNSIQARIPDANVLDWFAGSGALGFEALSRGAARVVFVEASKPAAKLIRKNAELLGVEDRIEIHAENVESSWLDQEPTPHLHDLVLADPPYEGGWELKLLLHAPWARLLKPGGIFCLEWGAQKSQAKELPENVPFLVKIREKNYGDSLLTTYQRSPEGGGL